MFGEPGLLLSRSLLYVESTLCISWRLKNEKLMFAMLFSDLAGFDKCLVSEKWIFAIFSELVEFGKCLVSMVSY